MVNFSFLQFFVHTFFCPVIFFASIDFRPSISRRGSRGRGAVAGAHPWDGRTRAEGAGSLVSRAERRDTGVS